MGNQREIKLETGKYSKYVNKIDENSKELVTDVNPKNAPEACKQNSVIPDYEFADQSMVNTLVKLQDVMYDVVSLMNDVLKYHNDIDKEASGG